MIDINRNNAATMMMPSGEMQRMPRIRTVREVVKYCKAIDSETHLSEYMVRKMISDGILPTLKSGNRNYINLDIALALLNMHDAYGRDSSTIN